MIRGEKEKRRKLSWDEINVGERERKERRSIKGTDKEKVLATKILLQRGYCEV